MEHVILVRYGEIHLKGLNRPFFEARLKASMELSLRGSGAAIEKGEGRYYVSGYAPDAQRRIVERLLKVFGVHSISPALVVDKREDEIYAAARALMEEELTQRKGRATFKVNARRADKRYPKDSMQINRELGGFLLESFGGLSVDVREPQIELGVEIRERAYLYCSELSGAGGMPENTNGHAALLLSGGIDSPVAGHMIARRGVKLSAVHFHSFPFTGERAKEKVLALSKHLAQYAGEVRLFVVPFTKIQTALIDTCRDTYITVLMRRMMMRISEAIALREGASALITGEAIGQVASQTMQALVSTDECVKIPVFRPLIGMDKLDIINAAKRIGTYETSILPYEDCCTIFVPKHPVTQPKLDVVHEEEAKLDWEPLLGEAISNTEAFLYNRPEFYE